MRQIFLDTETTGLDPRQGHRVIEIGAVEMMNRRLTGNRFHYYLQPDRDIDANAQKVHGISLEFLQDKPRFRDIADEFLGFIGGAELIIHNAPFDLGFLNAELALLDRAPLERVCPDVIDTLVLAKELHPGKRNKLDALCERYAVDNSGRTLHGALLDSELLAEVYLAMTRGQDSLMIGFEHGAAGHSADSGDWNDVPELRVVFASVEERAAHEAQLAQIGRDSGRPALWLALETAETAETVVSTG